MHLIFMAVALLTRNIYDLLRVEDEFKPDGEKSLDLVRDEWIDHYSIIIRRISEIERPISFYSIYYFALCFFVSVSG